MFDRHGNPLNIGDKVLFPSPFYWEDLLFSGTITRFGTSYGRTCADIQGSDGEEYSRYLIHIALKDPPHAG